VVERLYYQGGVARAAAHFILTIFNLQSSMQQAFWLFGTHLQILDEQQDTAGRYDLVEGIFQPNVATPLHRHTTYSNHLYVLEGEFTVHTESGVAVLKPCDSFHIPQGLAHAVVSGPAGARGLVVASPSGFARLIREAGTPASSSTPPSTPPNMEAFGRASLAIGDELVGPPPIVA
jgi:quercetin dioxygenase-like cupin family protein